MTHQIIDIVEIGIPGQTGGVTPELLAARDAAIEARDQAEMYASDAAEIQDVAVSGLLGSGAQSSAYLRDNYDRRSRVSVRNHGAVGNGSADDTAAFVAAAAAAEAAQVPLWIPAGTYRISNAVTVRADVVCDGELLINAGSAGELIVLTRTDPVMKPHAGVGGLTAGSTKLTGITGSGVLAIRSTDKLINRHGGGEYTKNEVVELFADGTVSPPLEHTYDMTKITRLDLYAPGSGCDVSGVRIRIDGTGTKARTLTVVGSHNTISDCALINSSAATCEIGVTVADSLGTTINNLAVAGFDAAGLGYGLLIERSAKTVVNLPSITKCLHAIAGRHNRGVVVNGGTLHGGFDTHWGGDVVLDQVTSIIDTSEHVLVAGVGDVTIRGGRFVGGRQLVALRIDTPTLDGHVHVAGAVWEPAHTVPGDSTYKRSLFGFTAFHDAWDAFAFAYPMRAPDVTIENITVKTTGRETYSIYVPPMIFARQWARRYTVRHVKAVGTATAMAGVLIIDGGGATAGTLHTFIEGDIASTALLPVVDLYKQAAPASVTHTVVIRDARISADVRVGNPAITAAIQVYGSRVGFISRESFDPEDGASFLFSGCVFDSVYIHGRLTLDAINCEWRGATAVGSGGIPINDRIRSFIGNRKAVGQTGAPTRPDGYRNAAFYETS